MADKDFKVKQGLDLGIPLSISEGGTGQTSSTNAINALLPVQTGENGKFLTTDGTNTYWAIDNSGVSLSGGSTITAASAATKGLVIQGAASQSADLQQWQNSSGTVLTKVDSTGQITSTNGTQFGTMGPAGFQSGGSSGIVDIHYNNGNLTIRGGSAYSSNTSLLVSTGYAGGIGQIIKGSASQTANLQEWQNSAGSIRLAVSSYGTLNSYTEAIFNNTLNGTGTALLVKTNNAGGKPLVVQGAASQTADLQQWQDSAGTVLTSVTANGRIFAQLTSELYGTIQSKPYTSGAHAIYAQGLGSTPAVRIDTISATANGLIIKGAASQTANLQEWQNSAGTILARIGSGGAIVTSGVGVFGSQSNISNAQLGVVSSSTIYPSVVVRGAPSQTADLQQWQNSAGTVLAEINANGGLELNGKDIELITIAGAL